MIYSLQMIFWIKKFSTPFFYPLTLLLLACLASLIFWNRLAKSHLRRFFMVWLMLFYACSTPWLPRQLLSRLENRNPPLKASMILPEAPWIVVLGGGIRQQTGFPLTSQCGRTTTIRLAEGLRLLQTIEDSRLLLSGGALYGQLPEGHLMNLLAVELGAPPARIITEEQSMDTKDQALFVKSIVGTEPFLLVTSAYHMPRSLALFRKQGLSPIPAPTDFTTVREQSLNPAHFFPDARNLAGLDTAIREHLGLLWAKIRGQA